MRVTVHLEVDIVVGTEADAAKQLVELREYTQWWNGCVGVVKASVSFSPIKEDGTVGGGTRVIEVY